MTKRYFTIGMAGHIDHGKTTLTKALTNVDTDRLKEEKERQISIELGFAPLYEDEEIQISLVDVPGHERFIRQMIAGVAGIDLVVLVVAADEGVMPQTKEHIEILGFLGIKNGIIAVTKIDRVEEELLDLVKEEINDELHGSVFEDAPVVMVDSLSHKGTEELKQMIIHKLKESEPRETKGDFRLPIDQVFTIKGQGTIVRGTVYEGIVEEGQLLKILPKGIETRARQIQTHHKSAIKAFAGQRVAINLGGVAKEEIERGNVAVSSDRFHVTRTIDVSLSLIKNLGYLVKQRMPMKCHIGTSEVMGRIVFFDRNEAKEKDGEILCQLRLEEDIVVSRGDRFIIRRPSPQETIGGGWVIDPSGEKHRFGQNTVEELQKKKEGTAKERIVSLLLEEKSMNLAELSKKTALDDANLAKELEADEFLEYSDGNFTLVKIISRLEDEIRERLMDFHSEAPLKIGLNKAELLQTMRSTYPKTLLEYVIEEGKTKGVFSQKEQFVYLSDFTSHVPKGWQKRVEGMLQCLIRDGIKVRKFQEYFNEAGLPKELFLDLTRLLEEQGFIVKLEGDYFWDGAIFQETVRKLRKGTSVEFEVSEAKAAVELSRRWLIPFLEKLDEIGLTDRIENKRIWKREW
ncbi:selenocysteine-specific translation elongation factor [Bacillus massilinigeriensis]|uniref:selenocysteine-specific translation elongation factor n=1 Tax=Bacillus massilionigeriensis TaxID=1805475 RepID=UPI00096B2751|nr:selenocysteine-specific translation elongation factor [Bacillus massilionigeriensis]